MISRKLPCPYGPKEPFKTGMNPVSKSDDGHENQSYPVARQPEAHAFSLFVLFELHGRDHMKAGVTGFEEAQEDARN